MNVLMLLATLAAPVGVIDADKPAIDIDVVCQIHVDKYRLDAERHTMCVEFTERAVDAGIDPFFAVSLISKETKFDENEVGDGGFSLGIAQVSMLYHCSAAGSRSVRFHTARERAKSCDFTQEAINTILKIKAVPKKRRTRILAKYESGKLRVPTNYRDFYHMAAEYKGGPQPNIAAHKSAWRLHANMRLTKKAYLKRMLKRRTEVVAPESSTATTSVVVSAIGSSTR